MTSEYSSLSSGVTYVYKNFIKIIFFLFLLAPVNPLTSSQLMTRKDVKEVMEELFVYHVEYKSMNPEIMRRAFQMYVERFDGMKNYLTEKEAEQFLNPSKALLTDAVERYRQNDLYYFDQLHATIESSIRRARANRQAFQKEVHEKMARNGAKSDYELLESFPKSDSALMNRQKAHMERFLEIQKHSTPFLVTANDYEKMSRYYEMRMCEFEDLYLTENDALREHIMSSCVLKSLARSLDAHTDYFSQDEAKIVQGSLSKGCCGIGVVLQRDFRGIVVREVLKDGPADRSQSIFVGDELLSIDSRSIEELSYKEVMHLLEGPENSKITLTVRRADDSGEPKEVKVSVQREKVALTNRLIDSSYEECEGGIIGKITLNSFYDNQAGISSSKDMRKIIESFKQKGNLKGLILDMRENTGGFLVQAVEVAGLFITNGVVVIAKLSDGKLHYFRNLDGKVAFDGPLILLTSKLSASSTEIVAGTLQDYGVAVIAGDPTTFGKGSIQYQTITLPKAKHYYTVTIGRYYTVSGKCTQLEGVKADIVVPSAYYEEKLGERYLAYPLTKDRVDPAFEDSLSDLDPRAKDIFTRFYLPTLQKRKTVWEQALPELKKNSAARLAKNRNYQLFMEKIRSENVSIGSAHHKKGQEDLQMTEAIQIMKEMMVIQQAGRKKERATAKI